MARNNAYALLRERPRSEAEIRRRLAMKGYGPGIADAVVSGLRGEGLVDDAKFARLWIESRMHSNPAGDVVLRHELKEKGVGDAVIEAALGEKAARFDECAIAAGIAKERFARMKKIERPKAMKRVYDFLVRRGFGFDTVRRAIEACREDGRTCNGI